MKAQQALETMQPINLKKNEGKPLFVEAEKLIERMEELTKTVARRAYEFFESRGRSIGNELEDWFRAEAEVLRRIPATMKEDDSSITIQAEVPGFKADEIKISAEPNRLMIEGCSEQSNERKSEKEAEKIVFSERCSNHFYRSFRWNSNVDPAKVTANLKDGVLEVTLPKIATQQPVGVEIKTA
ncbi:MAG: Hsp20 family protein [Blastocatellia bacterium]